MVLIYEWLCIAIQTAKYFKLTTLWKFYGGNFSCDKITLCSDRENAFELQVITNNEPSNHGLVIYEDLRLGSD